MNNQDPLREDAIAMIREAEGVIHEVNDAWDIDGTRTITIRMIQR